MSTPTRQLGVVGWPVSHSYSPAMQEAAFAALGLDWRYGSFAVPPDRLGEAISGAGALGFVGLNVTVPHKEEVLHYCEPDEVARSVGAVNTLIFGEPGQPSARRPIGVNTDVYGFRMLLEETGSLGEVRGQLCVVLGAGGAARAAVRVLLDEGATVAVVTRSERQVRFHDGAPHPSLAHYPWSPETLGRLLPEARLLVDATPRGLEAKPHIDIEGVSPAAMVIDLVARTTTPLVEAARRRGVRRAVTGEIMLLHQGALALERWSGQPPPVEVMRAALRAALQQATRSA